MPKKSLDKKSDIGVMDRQKNKIEPPKKYKVIFHNDDYTSFQFVEQVLIQLFHKSAAMAKSIATSIHNSGKGIAGVYPKGIAETKAHQVNLAARAHGVPLLAEIEPE